MNNYDRIRQFEEETGLKYDPNGPAIEECECGQLFQYIPDHSCYIIAGNSFEARKDPIEE